MLHNGTPSRRKWTIAVGVAGVFTFVYLTVSHDIARVSLDSVALAFRPTRTSVWCPSLHAPDSELPPIVHAQQSCSTMPSAGPAFALELCHDPRICNAFTLRITRTDLLLCRTLEEAARALSEDPALDAWIKSTLGPDAFELVTDGAERFASTSPVYDGACRWRYDVRLRNAGPVLLSAWHAYENYTAYDELEPAFPEHLRRPLFTRPVKLEICAAECETMSLPPQNGTDEDVRSLIYPPLLDISEDSTSLLPPCPTMQPVQGSYLPLDPADVLYPPVPLPQSVDPPGMPVAGRYGFVPRGCTWPKEGARFGSGKEKCVERTQRVVAVGDSHGRVVFDALAHRLKGETGILAVSEKQGHKSHKIGNVDLEFFWDPTGIDTNLTNCAPGGHTLASIDDLILSVSAHIMGHQTLSSYLTHLTTLLSSLSSCPLSHTPHLIFLPSPALPPRADAFVRSFQDRRSNARAKHWRDLILPVAEQHGWRAVDHYELTLPHAHEIMKLDAAHYLGTDALDAVVDEVLAKSGLCE